MKGFAIFVYDLNQLEIEDVVKWCGPLFPERLDTVPIFECKSLQEYVMLVNQYDPGAILLASEILVKALYGETLPFYSIRIEEWGGKDVSVLAAPNPYAVDWSLLEPALDRLEEIL